MSTYQETGFEIDKDWLKGQIKALKLLASFPHITSKAIRDIGNRISIYERHKRRIEFAEKPKYHNVKKPVVKLSEDFQIIESYGSITAAGKAVGVNLSSIQRAVAGLCRCKGHRFMLKSDYLKQKHAK